MRYQVILSSICNFRILPRSASPLFPGGNFSQELTPRRRHLAPSTSEA